MDFGIGFLSNNVMLPILDFFYGIVPSYGLAIIALTLVIRFALYPLSAGSIRSMRRMRITQPVVQKRVKEIQERYRDDPTKQQEEMSQVYKEYGNPLSGCFPVLLQMPILFALFATLRGSPFADVPYTVDVKILPAEQMEQVLPEAFATPSKNIYLSDGVHVPVVAMLPAGNRLGVGDTETVSFQSTDGQPLTELATEYGTREKLQPRWEVTKGADRLRVNEDGSIEALQPGDATLQATVPGLAADRGFLFVSALGHVGAFDDDGTIHWDIIGMVLFFGLSLYVSQAISGQGAPTSGPGANSQSTVNKITPIIFSGMFLFFPLPAGVLMYMVTANIFQTLQAFILSREPLPENIQKLADAQVVEVAAQTAGGAAALPFEPTKKAAPKGEETPAKANNVPKNASPGAGGTNAPKRSSKPNRSSNSKKRRK
jgi:YidC/Oxa1 family membrane protein insertase